MILPILYSLFNIGTVVCIVVVNKTVFQVAGFQFPTLLVGIHCGITHIGLRVAALLGAFERRKFPKRALIVLALSFIGYNVASLANLALNTVGFYQISKIMATPTTMALESVWLGKKFPRDMRYAVGVMCVGVGLATVTDVQATWIGGLIAIVAAMGAAQSYIFIGKTQHDLGASSNQLLVAYTPYCFVFLMLLSPLDTLLPKKNPNIADNAMIWIMERMTFTKSLLVIFSGCIGQHSNPVLIAEEQLVQYSCYSSLFFASRCYLPTLKKSNISTIFRLIVVRASCIVVDFPTDQRDVASHVQYRWSCEDHMHPCVG
mmetsp:Transcript_39975/g.64091  ORF Transcript_39975/g.64091 Transcript_39975/m.64091 type:complete len:317 (+) Transcript_39975:101-1051(+)